jgi:hypothetical protein
VVKEEEDGGGVVLPLEKDTAVERDEDTLLDGDEQAPAAVLLDDDTLLDTTVDRDKDTLLLDEDTGVLLDALLLLEPNPPVPAPGAYKLVSEKR